MRFMDSMNLHGVPLELAHIPGDASLAPLVFLHEGLGSVSMWTQRGQSWPQLLCQATGRAEFQLNRDRNEVEWINLSGRMGRNQFTGSFRR